MFTKNSNKITPSSSTNYPEFAAEVNALVYFISLVSSVDLVRYIGFPFPQVSVFQERFDPNSPP